MIKFLGRDERTYPNIYQEVYAFVNKLFTEHVNKFKPIREDINDYLIYHYGINIDKDKKVELFRYLENMEMMPCHLIVMDKDPDNDSTSKVNSFIYTSKRGWVEMVILIPENVLCTGMHPIIRFFTLETIYEYIMKYYAHQIGDNTGYLENHGSAIMAAFTLIDNKICDKEDLPNITDWETVFKSELIDILVNRMFKIK